jgi:tRNA (adenine37-N6)-methyltransferase
MDKEKVEALKKQIEELKMRWPAHSVPPAMMEQLDELEQELSKEEPIRIGGMDDDLKKCIQTFHLVSIGYVENAFDNLEAPDLIRSAESRIILQPSLVEGLKGFEPGQQIMVIYYFHRSPEGFDLLQHPRGDRSQPARGVFALRSPRRPNPIGVTVVDLISIEGNVLRVLGLDAINGTLVLDLKSA